MFGGKKEEPKSPKIQQEEPEEELLNYQQFKPGEYLVHILIEQTRGLLNPQDPDKTIDPLVQVKCFGQTRYSQLKSGAGTQVTSWNEHLHFTKKFDDGRALQGEQIKFSVMNHKYIGANSIIGSYELDFSTIYMQENRVMNHKWLGLVNPQRDFNRITGFLKVSINIVGEGDKQVPLAMENEFKQSKQSDEMLFGEGNVLLPPHIQTETQTVKITVGRAERLMKMDTLGTIDPFLVFECGTSSVRTETIESNQNPHWEKILYLQIMSPSVTDSLMLKLYDYDRGRADEIVGSQQFKIDDIRSGVYKNPFWINLYGAHIQAEGEKRAYLCSHPDLGTQYAGRLLLQIEFSEDESQNKSEKITDPKILQAFREATSSSWDCVCDFFYVMNAPSDDRKYSVKLRWADQEISTSEVRAKNGLCEYFVTQQLKNVVFPYRTTGELPDIFLYLMDHDLPICYRRFKASDIFMTKKQPYGLDFVKAFVPDFSIKDTDIDKSGILKARVGIQPAGASIGNRQLVKPKQGQAKLYVNLYQASQMIPSDMDGLADPLCQIIFYDQKVESFVVNNSLSPIWNLQLALSIPTFQADQMPPIFLRFFDQDKISRDFMGQTTFEFDEAHKSGQLKINSNTIPDPVWTDIKMLGKQAGRVLVSFNYFEQEPQGFPNYIAPKTCKYFMRIRALGLRSLKSFGSIPVTKAFIKFNLNSVKRPEDTLKGQIMTQPKDAGPNPNIQTIIAFDIMLPRDRKYMPTMQCTVHDYVFKGLIQPVIGQFEFNLHDMLKKTQDRIESQFQEAGKLLVSNGQETYIRLPKDYGPAERKIKQIGDQSPPARQGSSPGVVEQRALIIQKKDKLQEQLSSDDAEQIIQVMKEYGILDGDRLLSDNVVKYVSYDKNDDGTWFEVDSYPEEFFVPLGYDTQQRKSDLLLFSMANKNGNMKLNQTAQRRFDKEMAEQNKKKVIEDAQTVNTKKAILHLGTTITKAQQAIIPIQEEKQQDQTDYTKEQDSNRQNRSTKHYRFCLPCTLEESLFMTKNTFDVFNLHKGIEQIKKTQNVADLLFGIDNQVHKVGQFRGWVDIVSEEDLQRYRQEPAAKLVPNILEFKPGKTKTSEWDKELVTKQPVIVRVYVIDAFNLPSKDITSQSDPFIIVTLGNQKQNNKKEYKEDTCNPEFYKLFQFSTELPGASSLNIAIWDYDLLKPNELIGETIIDIEERYFQKRWRQLKQVPIETRQLYHPSSSLSQGVVRVFVEIVSAKIQTVVKNPWIIDPRPPMKFHVRVVVWDVFDAPSKDDEDMSDLYVVGYLEDGKKQKTDTHYRASGGRGSFNWRMVFPITLPQPEVVLSFQIFDKDILTPDDFISDCTYDLTKLAQKAFENEINVKALSSRKPESDGIFGGSQFQQKTKDGVLYEKIEIVCENAVKAGEDPVPQGKIVVSIEILPEAIAEQNPVGLGRDAPNNSPPLPPPTGRIQWSMNPYTLLGQLLGPKYRAMVLCLSIMSFLLYLVIMEVPVITGNVIARHFP